MSPSIILLVLINTLPDTPGIPPESLAPKTLTSTMRILQPLSHSLGYTSHGIDFLARPRFHARRVDAYKRHPLQWPSYRDAVSVDETGFLEVMAHESQLCRPGAEAREEQRQAEEDILVRIQCALFNQNVLVLLLDIQTEVFVGADDVGIALCLG